MLLIDISSVLGPQSINTKHTAEHDFSIVESPDPFGAGALIPIDKRRAEKKGLATWD